MKTDRFVALFFIILCISATINKSGQSEDLLRENAQLKEKIEIKEKELWQLKEALEFSKQATTVHDSLTHRIDSLISVYPAKTFINQ